MRVEITVEGQEPVVHKLTKDKTMLGSGQDCEIPISADGISRKHLQVIVEGDQFFVVDQGSTNGSFINEDRLVPGQRASFTSFFPVKMGFHVTIALLSDEEASTSFDFAKDLATSNEAAKNTTSPGVSRPAGGGDKTSVTRTAILTPSGKRVEKSTAAPSRKGQSSEGNQGGSPTLKILAFVIAFGGAGLFFYFKRAPEDDIVAEAVVPTQVVVPPPNLSSFEFRPLRPPGLNSAVSALTDQKCASAEEAALCKGLGLPSTDFKLSGVVFGQTSMTLVLPWLQGDSVATYFGKEASWDETTRKKLSGPLDARDLIGLFIANSPPLPWSKIPVDIRWVFVIFVNSEGGREGDLWMADLSYLRSISTRMEEYYAIQMAMRSQGTESVAGYAGLFRLIEPDSNAPSESTTAP